MTQFAFIRLPPAVIMAVRTENDWNFGWRFAAMPLTKKGEEIEHAMTEEYGTKEGERVFYASKNAGTISGVDGGGSTPASAGPVGSPTGPLFTVGPDGRYVIG